VTIRTTKIVLIGAGSASFGPASLRDVVLSPELRGSTLALVALNEPTVEAMARLARRMSDAAGVDLEVVRTTRTCRRDRRR